MVIVVINGLTAARFQEFKILVHFFFCAPKDMFLHTPMQLNISCTSKYFLCICVHYGVIIVHLLTLI